MTHMPGTVWTPVPVCKASALRWQVERIVKAWKSPLQLSPLPTKTAMPPVGSLSGRLLLLLLTDARCPARRAALWAEKRRELSLLNLMRHRQAVADRWFPALFAAPATLHLLRSQVGGSAARLVAKAARKRRPSAQRRRESLQTQNDFIELIIKLAA